VRLLQNPQECDSPSAQMASIAESAKHKPATIPVVIRPTRGEVLPYLGFRHITGVEEWEPLAKARYLKQLFDLTNRRLSPPDRYAVVAQSIGSRRDHVKRNLDALAVYEFMDDNKFFGIEGLSEDSIKFAVLSTALADDRIGEFVGVAKVSGKSKQNQQPERIATHPIVSSSSLKKDGIRDLSIWLYEKKDGKTVVGESRNLRQLAAIVAAPAALKALKSSSSLSYAYRLTTGLTEDFMAHLYNAHAAMEQAASVVANVTFDPEALRIARELRNLILQVGKALKDRQSGEEDEF
jgi:hypothetical protein